MSDSATGIRGPIVAFVLVLLELAVGWACIRAAVVRSFPATSPVVARLAADHADTVLTKATAAFAQRRGHTESATLDGVRRAAQIDPLDARPFLLFGSRQLAERRLAQGTRTLEAGQRLDPRNRLIHLLLLERYLRSGRYDAALAQFAVLARLVGDTEPIVANAIAKMTMAPDMRDAVHRTLRSDPGLERDVLTALARSDVQPDDLFALASPAALAEAGNPGSWGPVLVARLVEHERYAAARAVWQRLYRLSAADLAAPVFNPQFRKIAAAAPFNWTLAAGSIGAADPQNDGLAVDYYDRDSGDLATQLLVLSPGAYRLSFVVEGGRGDVSPSLAWTIACANGAKPVLANVAVPAAASAKRINATFSVPVGCLAEMLKLRGEASEFPTPANLTISGLSVLPAGGATS